MCLKVISLEADRNGQETAFRGSGEAPGGHIYQGGGTQAGNEAVQRAAAGSSAWIRSSCRGAGRPSNNLPGDPPPGLRDMTRAETHKPITTAAGSFAWILTG